MELSRRRQEAGDLLTLRQSLEGEVAELQGRLKGRAYHVGPTMCFELSRHYCISFQIALSNYKPLCGASADCQPACRQTVSSSASHVWPAETQSSVKQHIQQQVALQAGAAAHAKAEPARQRQLSAQRAKLLRLQGEAEEMTIW